ncbi:MAG: alpha/beta fold hydrolase, partial [Chloroflexi bacterium]
DHINGTLYLAQGEGPHPAVILLHGFAGYERNFDIAQALRRGGYNVLVFHYRGSWGSGGVFCFKYVLEDTETAYHFMRSSEAQTAYRTDPERVALVGHSMGGWAALLTAAELQSVPAVASIAGVNFGVWADMVADDPAMRGFTERFMEQNLAPLLGANAEMLVDEILEHRALWNTLHMVDKLAKRPVLLVAGRYDVDVSPHLFHFPLVEALEQEGAQQLSHHLLDSDHAFSNRRIALARLLLEWLNQSL